MNGMNPYQQGVVNRLRSAADLFEMRSQVYKDNYLMVGRVMEALFPDGHTQYEQGDHNRWHLFELFIVKLTRYVINYDGVPHEDSLDDMIVYLSMLGQLDQELRDDVPAEEKDDDLDGPVIWPEKFFDGAGAIVDQLAADEAGVKLQGVESENGRTLAAQFGGVLFSVGDKVRFKQHLGKGAVGVVTELDEHRDDAMGVYVNIHPSVGQWVHPAWLEVVAD
jgi:hypothetical protein